MTSLLIKNNYLGKLSDNGVTRVLVKGPFLIFYEIHKTSLEILSVWDSRQNPQKRIDY